MQYDMTKIGKWASKQGPPPLLGHCTMDIVCQTLHLSCMIVRYTL